MARAELFERFGLSRLQSLPMSGEFSGPGLKKGLRRVQIPVPPRGYWAKLQLGTV